jgi:T4 RnlA family RNA ligase
MIITKDEADKIVESSKNFNVKNTIINGKLVSVYSYFLNDYNDFQDKKARELRGLTFVEGDDKPYLGINKFFNLNENSETQYNVLKNLEVKNVMEKLDGSMIQIIPIYGELFCKTKKSFDNYEAKLAQNILDADEELKFFVLDMYENEWIPIFELIGKQNKIVIDYQQDAELKLIAVRNFDGEYIPLTGIEYPKKAKYFDYTLDEVIEKCKHGTGFEGFVVKFKNKEMIKVKSIWYLERHRIVTIADRKTEIIKHILNDTIDDVLSVIPDDEKKKEIRQIQHLIVTYVTELASKIYNKILFFRVAYAVDDYKNIVSDIENDEFAAQYKGLIMEGIRKTYTIVEVEERLKQMILKQTSKEKKAIEFLSKVVINGI